MNVVARLSRQRLRIFGGISLAVWQFLKNI